MDIVHLAARMNNYPLGRSVLLGWFCLEGLTPRTPEKIRKLRSDATDMQTAIVNSYAKLGFRADLLLIILAKKLQFICQATTKEQIREILKPSAPAYSCGVFQPCSQYYVEEEELLLWSWVTTTTAVTADARLRALELFERYQKQWGLEK